ncbi:hypothetical protein DSL72_004590 [Monilinia vaccinii-corymbosi]|uniref:Mid2 domain-containing protein n=1 Tax=Monilinia vaccinii-corymbosi TaxID=61207 RepID=A0A8A3P0W5_9HELO|nr:hypothetical protein DSL72_004590 [Monilinia vaccinii-corymbosi]
MSSSLILLSFSTIFGVTNAIPWAAAEKTATYKAHEWSPRPTNTMLKPRSLFRRGSIDVDICGWVGGNLAQPVGCASGSSCIHDTAFGFVGCCPTSSAGADPIPCTDGLYTTCIDYNSAGYVSNSSLINNGVLSCPSSSNCYKIKYPHNYVQFGCGPSTANVTAATTFAGQATDLKLQVVYTGVTFNPTVTIHNLTNFGAQTAFPISAIGTVVQSTALAFAGKGSLTASAPGSTASAAAASTGSSNTGEIVGGTVGALAVIIGASVAALLLIRKRGNKRKSSVTSGATSPEPMLPQIPYSNHSSHLQVHCPQMSGTNNLGCAPAFQSSYHQTITPVGQVETAEIPTPDLYLRNFRSPSPVPNPFQSPHSETLPESYDPSRPRVQFSFEPYDPSQSTEPQHYFSQSLRPENQTYYHYSPSKPRALRPRPSRSLPPAADLPPLDIMDNVQNPIASRSSPANWHLALTGDRRNYTPADGPFTSADHQHEPMPAMPALYADITTAMGAESITSPIDNFLPCHNPDSTEPGIRRNFSRQGRAAKKETENSNENETGERAAMSNNICQPGWVPSGLRTRNIPSSHTAPRMPDRRIGTRNGAPAHRYRMGDQRGEEVRIAYNPNACLNIGYSGTARVVGIGKHASPVTYPSPVEGGWL